MMTSDQRDKHADEIRKRGLGVARGILVVFYLYAAIGAVMAITYVIFRSAS